MEATHAPRTHYQVMADVEKSIASLEGMVRDLEAEGTRLGVKMAQTEVQIDRLAQGKRIHELTIDYLQKDLMDIMAMCVMSACSSPLHSCCHTEVVDCRLLLCKCVYVSQWLQFCFILFLYMPEMGVGHLTSYLPTRVLR